ncbi:MAG: exodeoxyribonuclease V alpha subunit, partial [Candidatus Azotimanducaceae bacterium]
MSFLQRSHTLKLQSGKDKQEDLNPFDWYFASLMAEINEVQDHQIETLFARLSHAINRQNSCLDLTQDIELQNKLANLEYVTLINTDDVPKDPPISPLILWANKLYLQKYYQYEANIARQLISRNNFIKGFKPETLNLLFPSSDIEGKGAAVIDWQKVAAFQCLTRQLCIITGGPGTGKTSTVVKILAALVDQNPDLKIKLAAPTGKAAARLSESIGTSLQNLPSDLSSNIPTEVTTIHRLLGMRAEGQSFRYHSERRLSLDLLILDETSMIDLAMFDKILKALPDHCRLIMLGDPDQLLSVESGAVMNDLFLLGQHYDDNYAHEIKSNLGYDIPKLSSEQSTEINILSNAFCHLTQSYRFNSTMGIGKLASSIQNKMLTELQSDDEILYVKEFTLPSLKIALTGQYQSYIDLIEKNAEPSLLLAEFEKTRVLTPMREGEMGINSLNEIIESSINKLKDHQSFFHGKPIMITRNDYNLGLFNGDIGICFSTHLKEKKVIFRGAHGDVVTFPISLLSGFETCFVMSIHKSQGSEFDNISVVLPSLQTSTNDLYTKEL